METIPSVCPSCGSDRVRPILYGMPAPEAVEQYRRGELIIGGCLIGDDDPTWGCLACDYRPDTPASKSEERIDRSRTE